MHGPPLQARVAAANGTVRSWQTAGPNNNLLALTDDDPGAHGNERGQSTMNRTGASKLERGQELMRAVGMAGKDWQAHSPQNRPLQADTASGLSAWLRPQNTRPQMASRAAKTTAA